MSYQKIAFAMHRADFNRLMDEHRRAAADRAQKIEQTIWEFVEFASHVWEIEQSKRAVASRCPDCGAPNELPGHMDCPYPQDHE